MRDLTGLNNIVLIGFMGTGKTSVGRRLAQRLNLDFVDSDVEIERVMGLSVSEIFERYKEVRFRSEEKLVIGKLVRCRKTVIATGGGAVLDPENLKALQQSGIIITLTAAAEVIYQRGRKGNRPLLKKTVPEISQQLAERDFAYRQGDVIIDTSELSPDEVVDAIVQQLEAIDYGKSQG